jgi:hypothetical protein
MESIISLDLYTPFPTWTKKSRSLRAFKNFRRQKIKLIIYKKEEESEK